jgi:hypothetical protein
VITRVALAAVLLGSATACGPAPAALPEEPAAAPAVTSAVPSRTPPAAVRPALPRGCSPRAAACVSTRQRVAWLQHHGRPSYGPVRVSLGRAGHPTPHGTFHVAWKDAEHTSRSYGIPMPYSVFFAAGGVAFHQGPLDESSHGCVHLGRPAAFVFFSELRRGDRVEVF